MLPVQSINVQITFVTLILCLKQTFVCSSVWLVALTNWV